MAGKRPDYDIFVTQRREGEDKAFYTKIGAAWLVGKDGISIKLQALPVDGECVGFPPRDPDDR